MKIRLLLSCVFCALLVAFTLSQIKGAGNVSANYSTSPVTSPTLTPTVTPTPAVTSPVTFARYLVRGNVSLKILKRWFSPLKKFVPGVNVKLTATNLKTYEKFETSTDQFGNYSLELAEGKYKIVPKYAHTIFTPLWRTVKVNQNKTNLDFKGYVYQ